jgi:hypothetical protein
MYHGVTKWQSLFLFGDNNTLCMKTEYRTPDNKVEAYIISTGEFFCGNFTNSVNEHNAQKVTPISRKVVDSWITSYIEEFTL